MEIRDRIVELKRVRAGDLIADPKNWRRHPPAQRKALESMLADVGYAAATLARETPEGLVLIDGHLRADLDPEAEVPVLVLDVDEAEAARLLATIDPLAAMAETDGPALAELLAEITLSDDGLTAELERMTGGSPTGGLTDPDAVPDVPEAPVTKRGDLWLLGEHRLLCGDAFEAAVLDGLVGSAKVGCLLTDPPYGIDLDTDYSKMGPGISAQVPNGQRAKTYRPVENDAVPFDASALRQRFREVPEQFWFGANYYRRTLSPADLDGSWLVWDKRKEGADLFAGSAFELIWSSRPHKQDLLREFWFGMFGNPEARERLHPTQKPVSLMVTLLERWAPAGCIVADLFTGSGSTLIAAEQTGRTAYLMEIDPAYCDVIVKRWEEFTGEKAVLDG